MRDANILTSLEQLLNMLHLPQYAEGIFEDELPYPVQLTPLLTGRAIHRSGTHFTADDSAGTQPRAVQLHHDGQQVRSLRSSALREKWLTPAPTNY
jgi:hypothetical protein